MYRIIQELNETTKLATYDNCVYVLKRISLSDIDIIKRLMSVNCPNIVRFLGFCEIGGVFYAVEEYISGVTLKKYIEIRGALDEATVRNVSIAVCSALAQVHSLGIVHRDINPNNIMIDNTGVVKVIDFDISRITSPYKPSDTQILGTQGYAAPEQYGFSQTNYKADVYSLGVLINYMLTLRMPNEKIADSYFTPIILKCIEIDENNRYSSVEEIMLDIDRKRVRKNIMRSIPGFRSNKTANKIIAICYYIFFFILEAAALDMPDSSLGFRISAAIWVFFYFGLPVLIAFDFMNYLERLPFTRYALPKSKRGWIVFFIFLSLLIGTLIILLSPAK